MSFAQKNQKNIQVVQDLEHEDDGEERRKSVLYYKHLNTIVTHVERDFLLVKGDLIVCTEHPKPGIVDQFE